MLLYRNLFHLILMITTLALWQANMQHAVRHLRLDIVAVNTLGEVENLAE